MVGFDDSCTVRQMPRGFSQSPLTDELDRFQQLVRGLALALVRTIVRTELERRLDRVRASLVAPTPTRPRRSRSKTRPVETNRVEPEKLPSVVEGLPAQGSKQKWSRESIIAELASWLASGTTIDASFVTRHGPRGLVAASRREFGRFEAALNVAGLRVAQLYPDKTS